MTTINAGTTCYLTVAFKDKAGAGTTPTSVSWRAIDLASGAELQPATEIAPAASVEIAASAAVNTIIGTSPVSGQETRRVIVTAVQNSEPVTGYYDYQIKNLEK